MGATLHIKVINAFVFSKEADKMNYKKLCLVIIIGIVVIGLGLFKGCKQKPSNKENITKGEISKPADFKSIHQIQSEEAKELLSKKPVEEINQAIEKTSSGPGMATCDIYSAILSTSVDITGDNMPENINLDLIDEGWEGILKVNNLQTKVTFGEPIAGFHITDIDRNDKYKEIAVHSPGPSSDDIYQIYWFDNIEIRLLGILSRWPEFLGDGRIIVGDWKGWWCIKKEYKITKENKLEVVPQRYYNVNEGKIEVTVKEEFNLYESPGSEKTVATLRPGEIIRILLYDSGINEEWYQIETKNKIKGWTNCINSSYIDGLPYAD